MSAASVEIEAAREMAVHALTHRQRVERVEQLTAEAHTMLDRAIAEHFTEHELTGIVTLFSGGNDSTALAHLIRERATHAGHADTTIGIEETRQFVRDTCQSWDLPLIMLKAPRDEDRYRALVLAHGFPGPAHHFKMYQRLKERALRSIQRQFVQNPRRERVIYLAGRRATESARRAYRNLPEIERVGSVVWVSPLRNWTKADLNTYRLLHSVPTNRVSDLIHMSGECLCGSFATKDEREEIRYWFPEVVAEIEALESEIADREDIPEHRRKWGWGAFRDELMMRATKGDQGQLVFDLEFSESGPLCSTCVERVPA